MLFSHLVFAIPGVPHQFFGSVTLNGSPAPDGTKVVTKIKGIEVASTITYEGKYGYEPIFFVDDPNSVRAGEEIKFFVNGVDTGERAIFCNACHNRVDLDVTIGGGETPGGGGGGGGGGGTTPTTTEEGGEETPEGVQTEQGCQERWTCSDWGACENGIQTRTCEDENNCGTRNNEPFSSQPCSTIVEAVEESGLLGFFLLSPTDIVVASIIGILIALAVILLVKRRKK